MLHRVLRGGDGYGGDGDGDGGSDGGGGACGDGEGGSGEGGTGGGGVGVLGGGRGGEGSGGGCGGCGGVGGIGDGGVGGDGGGGSGMTCEPAYEMADSDCRLSGMAPPSAVLLSSFSVTSDDSEPRDDGRLPLKPLLLTSRYVSAVR